MNVKSLFCPNCGASLEIEDGLDTFFCKYCGYRILLEGQSKAAYEAKVRLKQMEYQERLQEKRDAQERYKIKSKRKEDRWTAAFLFGLFGAIVFLILLLYIFGSLHTASQERELQAVVDQIMIDIKNEDFAAAYIKANSLYWDDSWSSDGEEKWNAIRKEVINQIEEAEKKATGNSTNSIQEESSDSGWFFGWFD